MNVLLAFLILAAPFGLAALLTWASHRNDALRSSLIREFGSPDYHRIRHDADATRTRFEQMPNWPASGLLDERR